VTESKELRGLDAVGLEHKYSSVGTLTDNGPPGAYEARFSTSESRHWVLGTTTKLGD